MDHTVDKKWAYLILRLALGFNMLVHGAGRLGANYEKFVDATIAQFANSPLPDWSVTAFSYAIPVLETIVGVLLILGLLTRYASILGGLLMVSLIVGMGTLQKWDIVGIQMIYVPFYCAILFFGDYNGYSVDAYRSRRAI